MGGSEEGEMVGLEVLVAAAFPPNNDANRPLSPPVVDVGVDAADEDTLGRGGRGGGKVGMGRGGMCRDMMWSDIVNVG